MMKKSKSLIFCMIIVVLSTSAQKNTLKPNIGMGFNNSYFYLTQPSNSLHIKKEVVAPGFYVNNLGFFCKQELKFQSATSLPLKFRLGTVQYCDWMEGKKYSGIIVPN